MQLKTFSIRDSKSEIFNTPFFQKTHGEAERTFRQVVSNPDSMPGKYPEDYDLYYLGDYDDQTGLLAPLQTPQHLIKAVQLKMQQQPNMSEPGASLKQVQP